MIPGGESQRLGHLQFRHEALRGFADRRGCGHDQSELHHPAARLLHQCERRNQGSGRLLRHRRKGHRSIQSNFSGSTPEEKPRSITPTRPGSTGRTRIRSLASIRRSRTRSTAMGSCRTQPSTRSARKPRRSIRQHLQANNFQWVTKFDDAGRSAAFSTRRSRTPPPTCRRHRRTSSTALRH